MKTLKSEQLLGICSLLLFFTIAFTVPSNAQDWTWMGGSNQCDASSVYGIKGVSASSNYPGSRRASVTWTDTSGNFWLFGGLGYDSIGAYGRLNDTWKFDITSQQWTWIHGPTTIDKAGVYGNKGISNYNNVPGGRDESIGWLGNNGNLWLFGGYGVAGDSIMGAMNDIWMFDLTINEWVWKGGSSASSPWGVYGQMGASSSLYIPGGRAASISWVDKNGIFYLMGGLGFDYLGNYGLMNDMWTYDPIKDEWIWLNGYPMTNLSGTYGTIEVQNATNIPGCRYSHSKWEDKDGNIWILGGMGFNDSGSFGQLNDLWKYDMVANEWVWMNGSKSVNPTGNYGFKGWSTPSNSPGGRSAAINWEDPYGNFWLLGGYGLATTTGTGQLNDLWKYDPNTNEWVWMNGSNFINDMGIYGTLGVEHPANKPGARERGQGWTDNNGTFWLMGGGGASSINYGILNDLWKITPNQIPVLTPPNDTTLCSTATLFSLQFSAVDSNNDSLTFMSMIGDPSIVDPTSISYTYLGNSNYLLNGSLTGNAGNTTIYINSDDGNGGIDFESFLLQVIPGSYVNHSQQICYGDSLLLGGTFQHTSGIYFDTLASHNGCDSIIETNLTVINQNISMIASTICHGESYVFGGNTYGLDGIYYDTLSSVNGCDSIIELSLNVRSQNLTMVSASICQGATYTCGGNSYNSSGNYNDTLFSMHGCDSIVSLSLHVTPINKVNQSAIICQGESYLFAGNQLTSSGSYFDTLNASNGCDSIIELDLNVLPTNLSNGTVSICHGDYYWFNGQLLGLPGTYTDTLSNMYGCDSIVTVEVSLRPNSFFAQMVTICHGDSIWFAGAYRKNAGTYKDTLVNHVGCDSISTILLQVNFPVSNQQSMTICEGDSVLLSSAYQKTSGTYIDTLTGTGSCPSYLITNLFVIPKVVINNDISICDGDSVWINGAYQHLAGIYNESSFDANGCEVLTVTSLTVSTAPSLAGLDALPDTLCQQDNPIQLDGSLNYLNPDIVNNILDPSVLPTGIYTIQISNFNGAGCSFYGEKTIVITNCTAINYAAATNQTMNVYPNPSNGSFAVDFGIINSEYYELNIIDELGRRVHREGQNNLSSGMLEFQLNINLEHLTSGIYFVRLVTENAVITKKLRISK